jgi:crotonobetainyl-CoA:carnitine CoA-transferase CaiB-like acyl-CoA transferase
MKRSLEMPMGADRSKHLLYRYKVLDFTQFLAGPTVTKLIGKIGAEIIKVELAPTGGLCRTFPYVKDRRSAYFVQQNRGKLSLCVDVKNAAGNAILSKLVPKVDVLVQNYAPG